MKKTILLFAMLLSITSCTTQRQFTAQELENIKKIDSISNAFLHDRIQELKEEEHD